MAWTTVPRRMRRRDRSRGPLGRRSAIVSWRHPSDESATTRTVVHLIAADRFSQRFSRTMQTRGRPGNSSVVASNEPYASIRNPDEGSDPTLSSGFRLIETTVNGRHSFVGYLRAGTAAETRPMANPSELPRLERGRSTRLRRRVRPPSRKTSRSAGARRGSSRRTVGRRRSGSRRTCTQATGRATASRPAGGPRRARRAPSPPHRRRRGCGRSRR